MEIPEELKGHPMLVLSGVIIGLAKAKFTQWEREESRELMASIDKAAREIDSKLAGPRVKADSHRRGNMDPIDATTPEETQAYYDRQEQEGRLLLILAQHLVTCETCAGQMLPSHYCAEGKKIMEQLRRWES